MMKFIVYPKKYHIIIIKTTKKAFDFLDEMIITSEIIKDKPA